MPVSERLMKPGSWQIAFDPATPRAVINAIAPFGHIVISGSAFDPTAVLDLDVRKISRYVGIVRSKPTQWSLAGAGLVAWLGDEEGKGYTSEVGFWSVGGSTFVACVTALKPPTVNAGAYTAIAGTMSQQWQRVSARVALDAVMAYFTGLGGAIAEYRVNNDGTFDAGPSTTLFATTPKCLFSPFLDAVDPVIFGIKSVTDNLNTDADSYTTRVFLVGATGTGFANVASNPYKDLLGGALDTDRVVASPSTPAGNETAMAVATLALYPLRQQVTLTSDRYDIRNYLQAGDWIWVYDPENGLHDETNPVQYAGQTLFPIQLRVYAVTWPVEAGMGVYYRDLNGVYTDLTRYIAWDNPGVTFEVGASFRTLTTL